MTSLEKLCRANRWRIRPANLERPSMIASTDADGWNGHFMVPLEGEMWHIVLCDQLGWKRLSIANAQRRELPSPLIMRHVKALFYGDDSWVVQFYPPGNLTNDLSIDLWESIDEEMPHPKVVYGGEQTTGAD
jgi:hypothetical protein